MKAIFLTEKQASEFIRNEFGKDAIIKSATVDNRGAFDIDEMPFAWDGETSAYEVNGEHLIGYYESKDAEYTISFPGITAKADSLYEARNIAKEIEDLAENYNVDGIISISDNLDDEIETANPFFDEEEESDVEGFLLEWLESHPEEALLITRDARLKIGKTIREKRQAMGLSIRALAEKCEMSKNNVDRIERGAYNYTVDNLITIANQLGLQIELQ